ncbi:ATP-binding protein [Streptomyces sp. T-3]|nr:ATP-binding protein [Streptomyces sp. T-3]
MTDRPVVYAGRAFDARTPMAKEARALASDVLDQARKGGTTVPAETLGAVWLVVTELMTNAGRHTAGPCVLELELRGRVLEISVWDTTPDLCEPTGSSGAPGRRRGLEVIRELCLAVVVEPSAGGKRIRARIALPQPSA